ncbi:MAG TPA: endolytic transglycosylase MltG [Chitinophagaceae bacterium]|nr:endolytic transglycosylase MltG [Chitinophagaceae bacterium]
MKKIINLIILIIIVGGIFSAWIIFASGTAFEEKNKFFVIEEGSTDKTSVLKMLDEKNIIKSTALFSLVASQLHVWDKLKAGKYEVKKGESLLNIARMLRNNHQAQINLVINKLRLKEDLAKLVSKNFASDSVTVMKFLNSPDSLKQYHVTPENVFTIIIPDTYAFYWNVSLRKIFNRLFDASNIYWSKNDRIKKADEIKFTSEETYILASIVEEETNKDDDKYKIASVYINRLNKKMALQACPTIKYAMKDFSLTRIYDKYLTNPSPYNTYNHTGLPPGPICTPSPKTIDIVLNAPKTDYLFFVAKSDFSGYHHFSNNYAEHNQYAKEYQKALDIYMAKKEQKAE